MIPKLDLKEARPCSMSWRDLAIACQRHCGSLLLPIGEKDSCFAAVHESPHGPFRRSPQCRNSVAIRGIADVAGARSKRQ